MHSCYIINSDKFQQKPRIVYVNFEIEKLKILVTLVIMSRDEA